MDTQSIGKTTPVAAAPQAPVRAQPAAAQSDEGTTARKAEPARTSEVEEQPAPQRDPRSLQYQVDRGTQRVVATIVDDGSRTIVRQIPDAELIRIAQAIDRMQGFLVEEKA